MSREFETQKLVEANVGVQSDVKLVNQHQFLVQIQSFFCPEISENFEHQNSWTKTEISYDAHKGSLRFFLLRSTGNKAVISSNTALKTSDLQLFNAGSTIKIGHFFADINPFEIKVSKPEISDFLKKNRILHQQI